MSTRSFEPPPSPKESGPIFGLRCSRRVLRTSRPSPSLGARGRTLLVLAGLALLAFALRAYRLDYQSLWRDEVDAVVFATRDLGAILATFTQVGENGPLFFLGLHVWIGLVGQSEFAIRFPSVIFGVLAVLTTYRLGRELIGREVALIAALLMAVSPYHIWYGQEAKMYALISFLAPLSLLLVVRAMRGGPRWLWLAWAVLMAAFLYVHLFATMMVLVAATWIPLLLRSRPRVTPALAVSLVIIALAMLPVLSWLVPAALAPVETGYYRYSLGQMAAILLSNFSMGLRPAAGLWPAIVFAVLLVGGMTPLGLQIKTSEVLETSEVSVERARAVLLLVLYLCAPLLAIWLVSLRRPTFTDRYLIISLPAFYLLIARGICLVRQVIATTRGSPARAASKGAAQPAMTARRRRIAATRAGKAYDDSGTGVEPAPMAEQAEAKLSANAPVATVAGGGRWLTIGMVSLVVLVSLPFAWAQTHNPYKADFRAATRYVVERAAPEDLIIFLMPYVQRSFAYYHPQPVRAVEPPYTRDMSQAEVDAKMRRIAAGSRKVWLFLSEAEFWDPQGLIPAWLERSGVRRCQQEFAYIEVRCYEMR